MSLKKNVIRYKKKIEIFLPGRQFPKKLTFVLAVFERAKKVQKSICNLVYRNKKTQLFSYEYLSQIAGKVFATQFSFTDHMIHKIVN